MKTVILEAKYMVTDVLDKLPPEDIIDYLLKEKEISDIIQAIGDDAAVILALGGISEIVEHEDSQEAVQDHVRNTNASRADSEREY